MSLPNLTSIANTSGYNPVYVEAFVGGDVELPLVTQITGSVDLETNSAGSTLNVSGLTTFTGGKLAYSGGTLSASGSTQQMPALTDASNSDFQITGGVSLSLPTITTAAAATFVVSGGSSLTLAGLTAYTDTYPAATLEATDTRSVLSLPNLTSIANTSGYNGVYVEAFVGGDVELPLVTQITGSVHLETNSAGSTLNVSDLTTFTSGTLAFSGGTLSASGNSHQMPALTDAGDSDFQITGGVSLSLPTITTAAAATFVVSGGSSLTLAGLTTYTDTYPVATLEATDTGSLLSLPNLTSIANTSFYNGVYVEAFVGGDVELPLVTQITGSVHLETNSAGSTLNVSDLTTFTSGTLAFSGGTLSASGNSHQMPALTDAGDSDFQITGGVSLSLPTITTAAAATFVVRGGSSLTLAGLTTYTDTYPVATLEATDTGSLLSLPNLTSIANTSFYNAVYVDALAGGRVALPLVSQISGTVALETNAAGSVLDLSALASLTGNGGSESLTITQGGSVLDSLLTTFANVTITTDSTGTFTVPASETFSFPSGTTTINTGTVLDQGTLNLQSSAVLKISGGLTINGQGGLSTSSNTTLDLSGNLLGNTTNSAGWSAAGTVSFDGTGTASSPQLLEAMSEDLGNVTAGFSNNFAYGTLKLTSNTYTELVDHAANSPGSAPQALYVNDLIVPAGATLNLDGLNLYVHTEQVNGTIISGGAVVSGEVFNDLNNDGTLDSGDPGLSGWTVELTSTTATYTTTTSGNGLFSLSGITAGTYTLSEAVQPGFAQTAPATPGTYTITVTSGQTVAGENFGDRATASISGTVYNDSNGDGTLENGEPGLSGWTVSLLNSASQIVGTVVTGSGGTYSFTALVPGTYTIQIESQSGYVASSPSSMTLDDSSGTAETVNFGEFVPSSISGEVFDDLNDSGTFAAGDPGLSGWTVKLVKGVQITETTTAADGTFSFSDVGPGIYTLEDVLQPGYVQTTPASGAYSITSSSGGQFSNEKFGAHPGPARLNHLYREQHGRLWHRLASRCDPGSQRTWRLEHDCLRHRHGPADDRLVVRAAGDYCAGDDRRHDAAWLFPHSTDRARWYRRRTGCERIDDHRR